MLTFKKWLTEAVKVRLYKPDPGNEYSDPNTLGEIEHTHDIDGNKVRTIFTVKRRRAVDVDFSVNHSFRANNMKDTPPETRVKILDHVKKKVDSWVEKNKPRELGMASNHPDKDALYKAFMTRLAAKHGYKSVRSSKAGVLPKIVMSDGPQKEKKKA